MLPKISYFFSSHKIVSLLLLGVLILGGVGFFGIKNILSPNISEDSSLEEIDLIFDPEGLYGLLFPRSDGNAMALNIKRGASYEAFSYVIAYTDEEGIPRGAGDENTWINLEKGKSEYEQEVLFGSCSKNVCKYDKGVENGTLSLRIKKGKQVFRTSSQWRIQKPDLTLGILSSGDEHFKYKFDSNSSFSGYTVINDLSGAPKLPKGKSILGKVYALNGVAAKDIPAGVVSIEQSQTPPSGSKIARFDEKDNKWIELETRITESNLEANSSSGGIFAVFSSSSN